VSAPGDESLPTAEELDQRDELASFRQRFVCDDDLVYLDGNSLGRLPVAAAERCRAVVDRQWGQRLIRSWNEGWLDLPLRLGGQIAPLIGAAVDAVLIADSTSVNLFKLTLAALQARSDRHVVMTDDLNFPSDVYILEAAVRLAGPGRRLQILAAPDGLTQSVEHLSRHLGPDTALVVLSHVCFKSGFLYPLAEVTARAHAAGAWVLWDLSHSAGVVPVGLNAAGVELAVGCTYKYLCGGPGAPAFLYVRRDLQESLLNPVTGWFGERSPFAFELSYRPAAGLRRFLTGTPPILSLAAIEPGVALVAAAGVDRLRAKSVAQTEFLIRLWEVYLRPLGFTLNSPRDPERRGSQVALGHPEGMRISRALIEQKKVIPDFRRPDNLRLGIAPLYTSFQDIERAVLALRDVVAGRLYEAYPNEPPPVT
jgi:kynureninase